MSKTFRCPKCDQTTQYNFCITRRPCGYEENSEICDDCGHREAFVDMWSHLGHLKVLLINYYNYDNYIKIYFIL